MSARSLDEMLAAMSPIQRQRFLAGAKREWAESTLKRFIEAGWHTVEPLAFESNWHIDAICDHLTAVIDRQIRRLIITVPPRHMKSIGTGVFMPPYIWAQDATEGGKYPGRSVHPEKFRGPGVKLAYISYGQELSNEHSIKSLQVIESPWYQESWGATFSLTESRVEKFANSRGGDRRALSFNGKITGFGADIICVDDAHNIKDGESDVIREETLRRWNEVLPTRLNDPRTGAFIVIMQRSHPRDLIGHILATELDGDWTVLNLPARYESDHPVPTRTTVKVSASSAKKLGGTLNKGDTWRDPRKEGEPLWGARFTTGILDEWATRLRPHAAAGQLQQRPTPREGGLFKRHWFEVVGAPSAAAMTNRVRSWDLAGSQKKANSSDPDWTVGLLMSLDLTTNIIYVEDVIRFRESPLTVETSIINTASRDGLRCRIRLPIDPAQAGKFQFQTFVGKLRGYVVRGERETDDKEIRPEPFAAQCEAGNVKLVRGIWNEAFLDELTSFPNGKKDQVDAAVGAFRDLLAPMPTALVGTYGTH